MNTITRPLDASQLCILENYRLFHQMKEEEDRIWPEYLFPIATKVKDDSIARIDSINSSYAIKGNAPQKDEYVDFWFGYYANWADSDRPLFHVGIELLKLKNIYIPSPDSIFWTYLYCPSTVQKADESSTRKLFEAFLSWDAPTGFVRPEGKREREYILVRHFDPMKPADFGDPEKLFQTLSEPLNLLLDWVLCHWNDLSKIFQVKK